MVSITKWLIYGLVGAFALSSLIDPARAQGTVQAFGGIGTALGNLGRGTQSLLTGVGTGASQLFNPLWTLRDLIYGPQAGAQVQKDMYEITSTGNTASSSQEIQQQQNVQAQFQSTGSFPTQTTPQQQEGMTPAYRLQGTTGGAAEAANQALEGFSYSSSQLSAGGDPTTKVNLTFSSGTMRENISATAQQIADLRASGHVVTPTDSAVNAQTIAGQNSSNATSGVSASSSNFSAGAAQAAGYSTGGPR